MDFPLPPKMEPFRTALLETALPAIRILPKKAAKSDFGQSKIGGEPFWPADRPLPVDSEGKNLFFLTQINFVEMPPLDPFPKKGLLQFWIADNDGFGLDFENGENQADFRVVFFPDFDKESVGNRRTDFYFLKKIEDMPINAGATYLIDFEKVVEIVPMTDYRFEEKFGADFFRQFGKEEWDIQEQLEETLLAPGQKIGGYAHFTQEDPRSADDPMLLLFQLDSDDEIGCEWGDQGVANFFIREKDLRAGDFSKVLFNWDCY